MVGTFSVTPICLIEPDLLHDELELGLFDATHLFLSVKVREAPRLSLRIGVSSLCGALPGMSLGAALHSRLACGTVPIPRTRSTLPRVAKVDRYSAPVREEVSGLNRKRVSVDKRELDEAVRRRFRTKQGDTVDSSQLRHFIGTIIGREKIHALGFIVKGLKDRRVIEKVRGDRSSTVWRVLAVRGEMPAVVPPSPPPQVAPRVSHVSSAEAREQSKPATTEVAQGGIPPVVNKLVLELKTAGTASSTGSRLDGLFDRSLPFLILEVRRREVSAQIELLNAELASICEQLALIPEDVAALLEVHEKIKTYLK